MKWLKIFFFCSCLGFINSYAFSSEWYIDKSIDGVEFWKHPELKQTRVLYQHQLTKNTYQPDFYQSEDFQKKLQQDKKKTLSFFGIENWDFKITKTEIHKEFVEVVFEGSYDDREGQKTYFIEMHLYGPQKVSQILFSSEKNTPQAHQKYFDLFLKQYESSK